MLNAFSSFINIIVTLVTFIINSLTSFINFISNIPTYSAFLINSINLLPTILIPFMTIAISIYIVLFIIGR